MSDQATYDARDWQRERDMAEDAAARGVTADEILEYVADLLGDIQRSDEP